MACCAIAEEQLSIDAAKSMAQKSLSAALESKGGELQSQSVGSWSKTYRSGGDSAKEAAEAVSYTHLDVYKRQPHARGVLPGNRERRERGDGGNADQYGGLDERK